MTALTDTTATHGTGQVITRFGAELMVETAHGELLRCTARRKLDQLACGDHVQWERQLQGNAAVTKILPRRNVLERPDFRGKPRAIAANNRDEIARFQMQGYLMQGQFLRNCPRIEGLGNLFNFEHSVHHLSRLLAQAVLNQRQAERKRYQYRRKKLQIIWWHSHL